MRADTPPVVATPTEATTRRLSGSHDAGLAGHQRLADQALSEADQAASAVDQVSSDADRAASAEGRTASRLEQRRADLEQRASDADQAASDADVLAGPPQTAIQASASRRSRALRRSATADRRSAASDRADADDRRAAHAIDRSRVSAERDSSSADRDAVADSRDATAERIEQDMSLTPIAGLQLERLARVRASTATARATAAEARRAAASVRARQLVHEACLAIEESRDADRAFEEARDADLALETERATELTTEHRAELIAAALPGAAARGELSLRYQPLFDLSHGEIRGFEALLRWEHPELGHVGPDEFIPIAEERGTIVPMGDWVLRTALRSVAGWRAELPGRDLTIAVNVAPEQLLGGSFPNRVAELLALSGVPPGALTLEITERTLVDDIPALRCAMEQLRTTGVQLSVDDFGTGFSSLGRLSSFPLDELKIDRIFVAGLVDDRRQRALVAGIVGMSAALNLRVVAEGIETTEQHAILVDLGCDLGQGYLMSRPLDAEALDSLLGLPGRQYSARAA